MNYSKNILCYEQRVNMLISNLLKHVLSIHRKQKDGSIDLSQITETEKKILEKLNILSDSELESFTKFLDVIDLGLLRYLNKYFIIDVSFDHGVNIEFRILSDPYTFRRITKKLNKEDKDNKFLSSIKEMFNSNYDKLISILKDIIEIENNHLSTNRIENLEPLLEKNIPLLEANLLNKFIINSLQPKETINE